MTSKAVIHFKMNRTRGHISESQEVQSELNKALVQMVICYEAKERANYYVNNSPVP